MEHADFIRRAIALSATSMDEGGGPFGAVIVINDQIIAEGTNRVVPDKDPTAHAEIVAIRRACSVVSNNNLNGAAIYTSCEPCPMCLGAIFWSGITKIYFSNTRDDAAAIGFDDARVYDEISLDHGRRTIPIKQMLRREANAIFRSWSKKKDKTPY